MNDTFPGFSMIWIHYKCILIKKRNYWLLSSDRFIFLFSTFKKTRHFVNSFSIWTNQITKRWGQLPWHSYWNNSRLYMAGCTTKGYFEMKRRNDGKGCKIAKHDLHTEKCFLESYYSYSHFVIPHQRMQKQVKISFVCLFIRSDTYSYLKWPPWLCPGLRATDWMHL